RPGRQEDGGQRRQDLRPDRPGERRDALGSPGQARAPHRAGPGVEALGEVTSLSAVSPRFAEPRGPCARAVLRTAAQRALAYPRRTTLLQCGPVWTVARPAEDLPCAALWPCRCSGRPPGS